MTVHVTADGDTRWFRNIGRCVPEPFVLETISGCRKERAGDGAPALEDLERIWRQASSRLTAEADDRETAYFWSRPLFRFLGFDPLPSGPVALPDGQVWQGLQCRRDDGDVSLIASLPFGAEIDRTPDGRGRSPGMAFELALAEVRAPVGYLLAGPLVRLYRHRPGGLPAYFEADIRKLVALQDDAAASLFFHLFRVTAFESRVFENLDGEGQQFALQVARDLRANARTVLCALADGYLADPGQARLPGASAKRLFEEGLIVLYRGLFCLFAESRGLLPLDDRTYRLSYGMHHLANLTEEGELDPSGIYVWESMKSLFALVSGGAPSADLDLQPFEGELFARGRAALLEGGRISDAFGKKVIEALCFQKARNQHDVSTERVCYRRLGVSQLGSIYEGLLASRPSLSDGDPPKFDLSSGSGRRKQTGAFYTPECLTTVLTERTLGPLVAGKTSEEILGLKVLDPAMGSGAFLVQACRFLAMAYARARLAEGLDDPPLEDARIRRYERRVAQTCLYGVDLQPLAVDLAKLSLWLETAASGMPLSFLDHRLRVGNSLIGARLFDPEGGFSEIDTVPDALLPGPVRRANRQDRRDLENGQRRFFDTAGIAPLMARFAEQRKAFELPEESGRDLVRKEGLWKWMRAERSDYAAWRTVADGWCALWFDDDQGPDLPITSEFRRWCAARLRGEGANGEFESAARRIAAEIGFFHWDLEFPEVFAHARPGFDAILANPPWEALEGRYGKQAKRFFCRGAPSPTQGKGRANTYKMFLERIAEFLAPTGRFGVIVPSGFLTDQGAAGLREMYFDRLRIEGADALENRSRLFPIDDRFKYVLMWGENGKPTQEVNIRYMRTLPESGLSERENAARLSMDFLERFSGPARGLPEIRNSGEAALLKSLFSRENGERPGFMTRTKAVFRREIEPNTVARRPRQTKPSGNRDWTPLVQGRTIHQFRHDVEPSRFEVALKQWQEASPQYGGPFKIVHRRIARDTDERTLMAAIVPAGWPCEMNATVIDVSPFPDRNLEETQLLLTGYLNSFVADFVMRKRVRTTLNMFFFENLPFPKVLSEDPCFSRVVSRAARLMCVEPVFAPLWEKAFSKRWRRNGGKKKPRLARPWRPEFGLRDFTENGRRDGMERLKLRAEIDATVARAFGLNRERMALLLDSFELAAAHEAAVFGEFLSKRLILEAMEGGVEWQRPDG